MLSSDSVVLNIYNNLPIVVYSSVNGYVKYFGGKGALSNDDFDFNNTFENNVKYYPNPTTNQLTLTHTEPIKKASVYNYLGQLVLTQNGAENTMQLNVSNLPNGNYLVKIESYTEAQTVKFVKE